MLDVEADNSVKRGDINVLNPRPTQGPVKGDYLDYIWMGQVFKVSKNPLLTGAPGAIRTPDPLIRSQILYPAELRARIYNSAYISGFQKGYKLFQSN